MMENEDWWYLVIEDDGSNWVEHEWSYVDRYGKHPPNSGKSRFSVDEFMAADVSPAVKANLETALTEKNG
jgi:hypothetical protein